MNDFYDPNNPGKTGGDYDDFLFRDGDFNTGQSYEKKPAKKLNCKKCGSDNFHVALGDFITIVRCVNCMVELTVHDG